MQSEKPIVLTHFVHPIPMPPGGSITPYKSHHTSAKNKKNKQKFELFTYYYLDQAKNQEGSPANPNIIKVLFKDEKQVLNQSQYPFTDPYDKMMTVEQLSHLHPKKVVKTEAVYIGHIEQENGMQMIVKKVQNIKMNEQCTEFETTDDHFESIPAGNVERFKQFVKILGEMKKAVQMSLRVIIDESEPEKPKIIDYEFFKRQDQIKKANKVFNGLVTKEQEVTNKQGTQQ